MPMPKRVFTTEELVSLSIIDTTSRAIKRIELVDARCYKCGNEDYQVKFADVLKKHEITGRGWRCRECFKKSQSEHASLRTGEKNPFYGKKHTKEASDKRHRGYKEWCLRSPDNKNQAANARAAFKEKHGVDNPMMVPEFRKKQNVATSTSEFKIKATERNNKRYESQEARDKTGHAMKEFYSTEIGFIVKEKQKRLMTERNLDVNSELNRKRIAALRQSVILTSKEIFDRVYAVHGDTYQIDVSTYISYSKKAKFIDKEYGVHWAIPRNVINNKACHPQRAAAELILSNMETHGVPHHMQVPEIKRKVFIKRGPTKPEKKFAEMLANRGIHYTYQDTYGTTDKMWDFVVYKDFNKTIPVAVIEIDGEYAHSIVSDHFGTKMGGHKDSSRFQETDGVIYLQIDSKKITLGFQELMKCFGVDYLDWTTEMVARCLSMPFPYPEYSDKRMLRDWKNLKRQTMFGKKDGSPSMSIIDHFHNSIYTSNKDGKVSPVEAWSDPFLLQQCVENRFIYCPSADITSMHIARGFEKNYIAPKVSVFSPHLAKYLLTTYALDSTVVRDPFSGFSGRMLGAVSLDKSYIGSDIREDVVAESEEIINFLNIVDKATVYQKDIESIVDEEVGEKSVVLTCPPYGLVESWSKELVNKTEEEWIDLVVSKIKADKYIFVVKNVSKYKHLIKENIKNRSHFATSSEYVLVGTREDFLS